MTESQSESISDSPFNHSNEGNDAIVPEIQIKIVSEEGMALLEAVIVSAFTGFAEIKDAVAVAVCKWVFKAPSCDVPCSRSSQSMPVAERQSIGAMENGMVENGVCSSESANENRDVWSSEESESSSANHLIIMIHGIKSTSSTPQLFGNPPLLPPTR
ncbi:hypothetical protein ACFX12_009199 [Malus domestica]